MTAVESKIPDASSLAKKKKKDYNTKISDIEKKVSDHNHDKYISAPEFNKLTTEVFAERLKQANLVTKSDFDDKVKNLNQKISSNKTKHLLFQNKFKKVQTFDSIYFRCKTHFEKDGTQNVIWCSYVD